MTWIKSERFLDLWKRHTGVIPNCEFSRPNLIGWKSTKCTVERRNEKQLT
jgi:hypothetical protein